ncbi:MAG: outer membrane protein assembly factor BamE [Desulfuromusa sp.]|nr:outer membrane protein assembly factor BamE [Desulfuromusa sp.]
MQKMMTMKIIGIMLIGFILLILTGCTTVGRDFPVEPVAMIKIGETTQEEIHQMFGQPWRIGVEDGQKTWTYGHYRYSAFGPDQTRDLVVRFDQQGKRVVSYSFSSTYEEDKGL